MVVSVEGEHVPCVGWPRLVPGSVSLLAESNRWTLSQWGLEC